MTTAIENYCIDCKAVAQPDCDERGHVVGTLGQSTTQASNNESPAPRAGEGDRWEILETITRTSVINEHGEDIAVGLGRGARRRREHARQIVTEHNQHSTLLAQRDRLLVLLRATMKIVADRMSSGRMLTTRGEAAAIWDEYNAAITTIEQEGKS